MLLASWRSWEKETDTRLVRNPAAANLAAAATLSHAPAGTHHISPAPNSGPVLRPKGPREQSALGISLCTASLRRKGRLMKVLGGRALKARRRRSGRCDAQGAPRGQVGAPGLGPGEAGPRAPGGSRHAVHSVPSALAQQPAHVGVAEQRKLAKRRARIKRAARSARIFPASGNPPSTPSGQRPPGE